MNTFLAFLSVALYANILFFRRGFFDGGEGLFLSLCLARRAGLAFVACLLVMFFVPPLLMQYGPLQATLFLDAALLFFVFLVALPFWKGVWANLFYGAIAWAVAAPTAFAVASGIQLFFPDLVFMQDAARILAEAKGLDLFFVLILLCVITPFVEEGIFRGLLYPSLRFCIGKRAAMVFQALIFAAFHYSAQMGAGNAVVIGGLFVFALYLSHIFEQKSSLFAPIGLHMTFNAASAVVFLFFA